MSNWNFDPRIDANAADPAVRQLQQAMMDLTRKLRVAMREIDVDNLAPDFLPTIQNGEKAELQIVKGKAPNAYFGDDGELFKVIDPVGGGTGDALSHMPVGYVYISTSSTSPQTLFGGTWKKLEGAFLLAANSTYPAGSTGGEAVHTLTTNELPAHNHTQTVVGARSGSGDTYVSWNSTNVYGSTASSYNKTLNTGGGAAHNNMPPYIAVHMWERTA